MNVLIKPLQTEKLVRLGEKKTADKQYAFEVALEANKIQIRQAIEAMYNVSITSLRTMVSAAKRRSRYTKGGVISGKTSRRKRAYVTLASGQEIDFYKNS